MGGRKGRNWFVFFLILLFEFSVSRRSPWSRVSGEGGAPCSGRDTDARGGRAAWGPSGFAGAVPLSRALSSAVVRVGGREGKAEGQRGRSGVSLTGSRGRPPCPAHGSPPRGGVGRGKCRFSPAEGEERRWGRGPALCLRRGRGRRQRLCSASRRAGPGGAGAGLRAWPGCAPTGDKPCCEIGGRPFGVLTCKYVPRSYGSAGFGGSARGIEKWEQNCEYPQIR